MKKLALLLIGISLLVIAFFQYRKYNWLIGLKEYEYTIPQKIDTNYFDEMLLQQYYENTYKIGTFARSQWKNHLVNVLTPDDDQMSISASEHFNKILAINKRIEGKLLYSQELKTQGYSNNAIQEIINRGVSLTEYETNNHNALEIEYGDLNHEVWELQQVLIDLDYDIPKDGLFGIETQNALKDFQQKNNLFPSGLIDIKTLELILK